MMKRMSEPETRRVTDVLYQTAGSNAKIINNGAEGQNRNVERSGTHTFQPGAVVFTHRLLTYKVFNIYGTFFSITTSQLAIGFPQPGSPGSGH